MPEVDPQLRRGLIALSAVLLFIGVVGVAVSGGDNNNSDTVASQGGPTTTLSGGGGDPDGSSEASITIPTVGPSGPTTTPKAPPTTSRKGTSATPATTAKPKCPPAGAPGPSTPASSDPGPTRPPALGAYCYSVAITDASGTRNSEHVAKVEAGQDSQGVTRRVTTRQDEQATLKTTEAWAADGVRQERIVISSGGFDIDCDWQPDVLVYAQPLSVGAKWVVDSSCQTTTQGPSGPVSLREQGERRVTGRATTSVGGTQIVVWVIETNGKLTVSSGVSVLRTDDVTAVSHFEPTRGLEVYDKVTTVSSGFGGGGTTTAERRLLSLSPS